MKSDTHKNHVVGCKVASSFVSAEQAELNLQREIGDADFDTIRQRVDACWNGALGRAKVSGGSEDQRRLSLSASHDKVDSS